MIMKKIIVLLAAMLFLVACNEGLFEMENSVPMGETNGILINLSIVRNDSFSGTKATVKSNWSDNDVVFVFFKGVAAPKYLEMKYDSNTDTWTSTAKNGLASSDLSNTVDKKMTAIYLPYGSAATVAASEGNFIFSDMTYSGYFLKAEQFDYTFDNNVLSGSLSMMAPTLSNKSDKLIHFDISGFSAGHNYKLSQDYIKPLIFACVSVDGLISIEEGTMGAAITGYEDGSMMSFSGILDESAVGKELNYQFTIDDLTSSILYTRDAGTKTLSSSKYIGIGAINNDEVWNAFEYVDLGLSVRWAKYNVGSTTPEGYGGYYAWGETETKDDYSWSTYKWCNGSKYTLTKYNNSSSYGIVDNKTILDPEDDVAHVKWGGSWRMPTGAELEELRNSCIWEWLSDGNNMFNGVAGYLVTSRVPGYQDRFIFLPAAGTRNGTYLNGPGSNGLIWSRSLCTNSTVSADDCIIFYFYSYPGTVSWGNYPRCDGYSVRPVCLTEEWLNALSITLSSSLDSIAIGGTITLSATIKNGDEIIDSEVTWSSDNPSIASVSETGVVTGNAVGSTTITATCMGKTATCTITVIEHKVDGYENEYEYVDLGLSVKWATCNVGASSPEEYGDHYAWGETEPKTTYDWSTYKFRTSGDFYLNLKFSKYNTNSDYGTVDNKTILDPEDDVAHVKWGGNWRMPTKAEQDELRSNCTWTRYGSGNTEFNGVAGYKVTSNKSGYTDRFIFLPAAGYRSGSSLSYAEEYGEYWSSSLDTGNPGYAQGLGFNSGRFTGIGSRDNGQSVRPVCP